MYWSMMAVLRVFARIGTSHEAAKARKKKEMLQIRVLTSPPLPHPCVPTLPAHERSQAPTHGRARLWRRQARACCYLWFYSFKAAMNSFLSSFACFIIEINVPFASSGWLGTVTTRFLSSFQSLDGRFSRDCRKPWQALLPRCPGKRVFVLWVPTLKEPDSVLQDPSSDWRWLHFRSILDLPHLLSSQLPRSISLPCGFELGFSFAYYLSIFLDKANPNSSAIILQPILPNACMHHSPLRPCASGLPCPGARPPRLHNWISSLFSMGRHNEFRSLCVFVPSW
jgi:hypothetical protein